MVCINCNEEYNMHLFSICPYCLFKNEDIVKENEAIFDQDLVIEVIKKNPDSIDFNCYEIVQKVEKDIAVVNIPLLSMRCKNVLRRNGIFFLSQLKEFLLTNELIALKNLGKTSELEIISAIIFLKSKEELSGFIEENSSGNLNTKQNIDRETTTCELEKSKIFEVHESLHKVKINALNSLGLSPKVIDLILKRKILLLEQLDKMPVKQFSEIIGKRNIEKFDDLETNLKLPLIDLLSNVFETLSTQDYYEIFLKRASGFTLQEIANKKNVTKERIRQLSCKFLKKTNELISQIIYDHILHKQYISTQDILDIYDNDEYDRILIYSCMQNEELEYLDFADIFVEKRKGPKSTEEIIISLATEFIGEGKNLLENKDDLEILMSDNGFPYIEYGEFVNLIQKYGYKLYGDYAVKGYQSYAFLCARLIAKEFPDGIKLYGSNDLNKLRELVLKNYGDLGLPENNRALSSRLAEYLILRGRGVAISEENIHIDFSVINQIKEFIDKTDISLVYYAELYAKFEGVLRMTSNIDNYNFLHGVLMLYYPNDYKYSRDYLQKNSIGLFSETLNSRIKKLIMDQNQPIHINKIRTKLPGISDSMIYRAIFDDKQIFQWEYNKFTCFQILDIDDNIINFLQKCIQKILDDNFGYCSDCMLFDEAMKHLHDFFIKNNIMSSINLFYISSFLFGEIYDFKRPHIGSRGLFEDLTTKNVALYMLRDVSKISFFEYCKIAEDLKWAEVTSGMAFLEIEKDYVRITNDLYIYIKNFVISNEQIRIIENVIGKYMRNSILPIINYQNWNELPNIGFEWNNFLLHSIIDFYGKNIKIIEPRTKDRRFERGIIVYKDSAFLEYSDVVAYALEQSNLTDLTENQMLSFMIINGLTYKVIPKEIYNSEKVKFIDDKFIVKRKV